jgi:hypothetical protein
MDNRALAYRRACLGDAAGGNYSRACGLVIVTLREQDGGSRRARSNQRAHDQQVII